MDLFPRNSSYVIIANASISAIEIAKQWRVAIISPQISKILYIKNDELSSYLPPSKTDDPVNAAHYKPATDRLQQMEEHETVQQTDDDRFNNDSRDEITIANKREEHCPEFLAFFGGR